MLPWLLSMSSNFTGPYMLQKMQQNVLHRWHRHDGNDGVSNKGSGESSVFEETRLEPWWSQRNSKPTGWYAWAKTDRCTSTPYTRKQQICSQMTSLESSYIETNLITWEAVHAVYIKLWSELWLPRQAWLIWAKSSQQRNRLQLRLNTMIAGSTGAHLQKKNINLINENPLNSKSLFTKNRPSARYSSRVRFPLVSLVSLLSWGETPIAASLFHVQISQTPRSKPLQRPQSCHGTMKPWRLESLH